MQGAGAKEQKQGRVAAPSPGGRAIAESSKLGAGRQGCVGLALC